MDLSVDVQTGPAGDVTLVVRGNLGQSTTAPFRTAVTLEGVSTTLRRALHTTGLINYLNARESP